MLNKRKRLRSPEVDLVFAKGRSARSAHLQLKLLPTQESLRMAAVVPKSVARKATMRNTLRRALYRALAASDFAGTRGVAVFFVRVVPKAPLTPTFAQEIPGLLATLSGKNS